ncbi:MAG: hypothetical protein GY816_18600 [Cytophagales bacterium]|nr:hypothetical protein [Cytophagales bacterium]
MNKVRINQGRVVDSGQRYMFSLLLVCGMIASIVAINNILGFIITLMLSSLMILMWTSFYVLEVDVEMKTYCDFTAVLGRKFGRVHPFDGIEKVFIKASAISQTIYGYGPNSYEKKTYEYDAYLKFTDGQKLFLASDEDKSELAKRLQPILKKLGTEIVK